MDLHYIFLCLRENTCSLRSLKKLKLENCLCIHWAQQLNKDMTENDKKAPPGEMVATAEDTEGTSSRPYDVVIILIFVSCRL